MSSFASPSRAEHAVNLAAASIPAIAAGWSAATLAPLLELPVVPTIAVASVPLFVLAYGAMRISGRRAVAFEVPQFETADESRGRVRTFLPPPYGQEELLLDVPLEIAPGALESEGEDELYRDVREQFAAEFEEDADILVLEEEAVSAEPSPLPADALEFDSRVEKLSELILDDPLFVPSADSRVVQLFAPQPMPTAGEMAASISRHIEHRDSPTQPVVGHDASEALNEALDSLRDTLRRA